MVHITWDDHPGYSEGNATSNNHCLFKAYITYIYPKKLIEQWVLKIYIGNCYITKVQNIASLTEAKEIATIKINRLVRFSNEDD